MKPQESYDQLDLMELETRSVSLSAQGQGAKARQLEFLSGKLHQRRKRIVWTHRTIVAGSSCLVLFAFAVTGFLFHRPSTDLPSGAENSNHGLTPALPFHFQTSSDNNRYLFKQSRKSKFQIKELTDQELDLALQESGNRFFIAGINDKLTAIPANPPLGNIPLN